MSFLGGSVFLTQSINCGKTPTEADVLRFGSIYNLYLLCFTRRWEWFTSENLLPLNQQLVSSYKPAIDVSTVGLYVARQWDERSKTEEALLSGTGVNGLVFSSFRFDNPKTVARGDWSTV